MLTLPLAGFVIVAAFGQAVPLAHVLDTSRDTGRYLTPTTALRHALALIATETPDADRYTMAALAARESHFKPTSGPHGHWPSDPAKMPRNLRHWIAGPCQTTEVSIADAVAVRDPLRGYASCAEQLGAWARTCRRWGKPVRVCQLAGFARGTRDAKAGVRTYADDVTARARRLRRAVERLVARATQVSS